MTSRFFTEWSDTETLRLLNLVDAGVSYRRCAEILHAEGYPLRTRNSLIGKVFRVLSDEREAA